MIYRQSIIPQHVSGAFTPIFRTANCVSLPMVSCPGCGCRGSRESGGEMCVLCRGCCLTTDYWLLTVFRQHPLHTSRQQTLTTATTRTGNHRQWHAVCCSDDERKDARNMLRNYWLPINHHLLHLVGLAFICLSKMHGQSSIKFTSFFNWMTHTCNKNQLDAQFILSLFRQSTSTCFGHDCSPSSGGILYIHNWYVLCFSVDCLLAELGWFSLHGCIEMHGQQNKKMNDKT
jgi:hypothetical protein